MLETILFHYSSTQEMYRLPPVQCQGPKNRKQYLIKSRRDIVSILVYPTSLSCTVGT